MDTPAFPWLLYTSTVHNAYEIWWSRERCFPKALSFAQYNGVTVDESVVEKLQRNTGCRGHSKLLSKERSTLINMRCGNSFRVVTSLWQFAPSLQLHDNMTLACSQILGSQTTGWRRTVSFASWSSYILIFDSIVNFYSFTLNRGIHLRWFVLPKPRMKVQESGLY